MGKIITVGREFGSGGREIVRKLAVKLRFAYYDHEIVVEIAKRTALATEYIQSVEEKRPFPLMSITTGHTFWASPNPVMDQQLEVLKTESVIIKEVAEKSDCVIVGRCADYVLRDEKPFRIFLYAELEFKMKRCRERGDDAKKMSDRELQRHMAQIDKKRAEYYAFLSGQKWGAKENYDLCINTSTADEDKIVNSIAELYR